MKHRLIVSGLIFTGVLALAACGASPVSVRANGSSVTSSTTATSSTTTAAESALCTPSQLTVTYDHVGVLNAFTQSFIYTVQNNTSTTTCELSNQASAVVGTNLQYSNGMPMTASSALVYQVVAESSSVQELAPGAQASLALTSPAGCPGTANFGYIDISLVLPGLGVVPLPAGTSLADCGAGSVTIHAWNPGVAPNLSDLPGPTGTGTAINPPLPVPSATSTTTTVLATTTTTMPGGPCAPSQVTVTSDNVGSSSATEDFAYTVKNTSSTTCELSNQASAMVGTALSHSTGLALTASVGMMFQVAAQSPSELPLAPGSQATLGVTGPAGCSGITTNSSYIDVSLVLPGLGVLPFPAGKSLSDCGTGSVTVTVWTPGASSSTG